MKHLLSKNYYCYKIHTIPMRSRAYSTPYIDTSPIWITPPNFYKKIFLPSMIFQKTLKPAENEGISAHYKCCKTYIAGGIL